jgi:hypothetical protein
VGKGVECDRALAKPSHYLAKAGKTALHLVRQLKLAAIYVGMPSGHKNNKPNSW